MTREPRRGRRSATLYALYVLLTTALAVLVVRVGVHQVDGGRTPSDALVEAGNEGDHRLPVRTGTPRASAGTKPPDRPPAGPTITGRPSPPPASKTAAPPAPRSPAPPRPPAPSRKPPPPPPPPPPPSYTFFLKSTGAGGNAKSSPVLPMSTARPTRSTVANYDTDRDDDPGLRVAKGGSGPSEPDPRKIQAWAYTASAATRLSGPTRLTLWYALERFSRNGRATLTVTLQDCAGTSCTTIGSASLLRTSWTGSWQGATFDLGRLNRTLAAGRTLRLSVVTDRDVWLAYDTTSQPSALRIG